MFNFMVKKSHLLKVAPFPKYRELRLRYTNHVTALVTVSGMATTEPLYDCILALSFLVDISTLRHAYLEVAFWTLT